MTEFSHLLAPLELAGIRLRNRALMGSMHTGLEETGDWGRVAEFYAARARGEAELDKLIAETPTEAADIRDQLAELQQQTNAHTRDTHRPEADERWDR